MGEEQAPLLPGCRAMESMQNCVAKSDGTIKAAKLFEPQDAGCCTPGTKLLSVRRKARRTCRWIAQRFVFLNARLF